MKIKQFKFKQILKLHLLKYRTYETTKKNNFLNNTSLTQTITDFKKILQIIFKYHQTGKRILFVGLPTELELKINSLTPHAAVPRTFNLQGFISNKDSKVLGINNNMNSQFPKSFNNLLPKLSQKPHLVIVLSSDKKQNIISESSIAKIPVVLFDNDFGFENSNNGGSLYHVQGFGDSFQLTQNKNLIFIGLKFLFKITSRQKRNSDRLVVKPKLRSKFQTVRK